MSEAVTLTLEKGRQRRRIDATRVLFSAHQCFRRDDGSDEVACLRRLATELCARPGLALYAGGPFLDYLLKHAPALRQSVQAIITDEPETLGERGHGLPVVSPDRLPAAIRSVFLCETRYFARQEMRRRLPESVEVLDPDLLLVVARETIPARAWTPTAKHIYPIDVPRIEFKADLDVLMMDCPARNLALMPNGLAYVHNVLKRLPIASQTFDLDVVTHHRYHMRRIFDEGGKIVLPNGREMPTDPWQAENYDLWADPAVLDYLAPIIDEAAAAIIKAGPKILGLSIQQCNEAFARRVINQVKAARPDTLILVGGFSCYNADIGLRAFPEADYMCIGEADLTVGPLVVALARGERPHNLPGVLSKFDTADYEFIPAPMAHNLDLLEFPKYEWFDLSIYRNYNGYQLVPIIASRGCRWSRCTFCAERFYWRIHSAKTFVDELEWLVEHGCTLFMFNESDLNGMPEKVLEICDEIIRRGLKVKLTGQLRIHKKSDRAYFRKLREAGFVALRFGVDAFSENTLRLQKKGYTTEMVSQNLKDCWEAGIFTEVNWVIGVPGETDADCEEGIALILANRDYIGRLANINPLILTNGGVYWLEPDAHNIEFHGNKDELYATYPRGLPADLWYSTEPFIDAQVRRKRFERIVLALHDAGFPVGAWAQRVIEDVRLVRDRARAGGQSRLEPEAAWPVAATPRLVRSLSTHNIVLFDGAYYAVPLALGDVDLGEVAPDTLTDVLKASSEEELLAEVDHAARWANSRGHFDARSRQRQSGSYLRAGSNMTENAEPAVEEHGTEIVAFGGEWFALDRNEAKASFARSTNSTPDKPLQGTSGLRRIAGGLPEPLIAELRRLWRSRRLSGRGAEQVTDDWAIFKAVIKGFIEEYGRRPLARLAGRDAVKKKSIGSPLAGSDIAIVAAVTKGANPDLLTSLESYNIVEFDGRFYACPHGTSIDWGNDDLGAVPGVIVGQTARELIGRVASLRDESVREVTEQIKKGSGPASEVSSIPTLLGSLADYNIVSYEGWVFGIPRTLGNMDLSEVDVIGLPGVIRDVSRDVVENEIAERLRTPNVAAQ